MKKHIKQAVEFLSDGCTYSPDLDFYDCCEEHDWHYHTGDISRKAADKKLRECIKKKGHGMLSWVYWVAVRGFGGRRYNRKKTG